MTAQLYAFTRGFLSIPRAFMRDGEDGVITVAPGLVDTPNGRTAGRAGPAALPFRRQATGWEIAYATLFFMSNESAYVTAQHLAVDSGLMGMT